MSTYNESVAKRLNQVHTTTSLQEGRELADLRLILFSDLHKGQRDTADDFQQCEKAYLAALEHYWQQGFELMLLGDVEELWECWPEQVIEAYRPVLESEQRFADAPAPSRYTRFVGNHDDQWYDTGQVEKHLGPYLGGHQVIEGLRLLVHEQGQLLGELFLVHGHQGTPDSDRFGRFSKRIVRYVWRPIQRALNIKSSTPSNDFELRQKHELAMYGYASSQEGMVLVAGHTHHPVWEGLSFEQAVEAAMETRGVRPQADAAWMEEQVAGAVALPGNKPSYFNTGCCSFSDRSITGIEIAGGEIRLVRWEVFAQSVRTALFTASLREVLAAVAPRD